MTPTLPSRRARALSVLGFAVIALGLGGRACADRQGDAPVEMPAASSGSTGQELPSESGGNAQNSGGAPATSAGADAGGRPNGATAASTDCGNGQVDEGEACDDGNQLSGDGCSRHCQSACETCERDTCPTTTPFHPQPWYSYAYTMEGTAAAGPKKGTPRTELVRSVLACVYDAKCTLVFGDAPLTSQISLRECFCKNAPAGTDPATYPDVCKHTDTVERGPCLDEMQAASETDTLDEMLVKLTNLSTPLGRAFYLLQHCDARVCGAECLPTETNH